MGQRNVFLGHPILIYIHIHFFTKQVLDTEAGHFYDSQSSSCKPCQKLSFPKKSCGAANKAAEIEDCHQYARSVLQFDKKCMKKTISKGKR